ncbi:MAG: DUF349 domain-containing protein, partial [Propionibacteriaceae bacterium]
APTPATVAPVGAATPAPAPGTFGRVAEDGTVFVRTADGERSVGQVPDAQPAEALAFFVRRYEALELEVTLLERRIASQALTPDDALSAVRTVRRSLVDANAVGDLAGLTARLDALAPVVGQLRSARKAERARQGEETKAAKERFVVEAEKLAVGNDWRGGVNRFRQLLEQWKQLPRLDRTTDDALWHRFSSARTTYTRRRKTQFAQQAEHRDGAQKDKEKIITEARALVDSTDWGPITGAFRDLMARWKAAGPAPRNVDEKLWRQFRELQDRFFAAKNAAQGEQDVEFRANQEAKEALLAEGEKLVPITNLDSARTGYRDLVGRWAEIGKVPRDAVRPLENRLRAIETAIKSAEENLWQRTNPEARARAEDTASKLAAQIAEQEERARKAQARGDAKAAKQAHDAVQTYRSWLEQAHRAIDDFTV